MATIGTVTAEPGIPTIINQRCEVTLDQRAFKPEQLRDMLADVKAAADRIAEEEGVEVEWKRIWQIDPIPFDAKLVDLAAQAVGEITGDEDPPRLPSGALHDAAEVARALPDGDGLLQLAPTASATTRPRTPRRTTCASRSQAYGRLYDLTAGMISEP